MDWGIQLRRARRRVGLSQRALAARTGIAQPTIARIEGGREEPRVKTLERLLAACGQRLDVREQGGRGVDRTGMAELLAGEPAARLQALADEARGLAALPVGLLAEQRITS